MVAIDNNGHNWTPSMHYGMNDLAGDNLLGNASFEGWQNTTSLYYWGGVTAAGVDQSSRAAEFICRMLRAARRRRWMRSPREL